MRTGKFCKGDMMITNRNVACRTWAEKRHSSTKIQDSRTTQTLTAHQNLAGTKCLASFLYSLTSLKVEEREALLGPALHLGDARLRALRELLLVPNERHALLFHHGFCPGGVPGQLVEAFFN